MGSTFDSHWMHSNFDCKLRNDSHDVYGIKPAPVYINELLGRHEMHKYGGTYYPTSGPILTTGAFYNAGQQRDGFYFVYRSIWSFDVPSGTTFTSASIIVTGMRSGETGLTGTWSICIYRCSGAITGKSVANWARLDTFVFSGTVSGYFPVVNTNYTNTFPIPITGITAGAVVSFEIASSEDVSSVYAQNHKFQFLTPRLYLS
jgi:hypothetical protein